jgi:16S rRNA G966 N2-methylase RsmD
VKFVPPKRKPKSSSKRAVSTAAVRRLPRRSSRQRTKTGSIRNPQSEIRNRPSRSSLLDTRVIFCGDNLDKLADFPDASVDLIYIDPPFNSNRNYEVFWGETREKRSFEDRHASTQAYLDFMRPRCLGLASLAQSQTLRL